MRRLAAVCAVAVAVVAALAALRLDRPPAVSAATNNLAPLTIQRQEAGCPLGPGFTFCDRAPGTASPFARFEVANFAAVSSVTATLAAVPGLTANFTAGDFTSTGNTCTGNLTSGQNCEVDIEFTPTTTGLREAALTVADAGGDKVVFVLMGTGDNLALDPPAGPTGYDSAYEFETEPVGGASAPHPVTVSAGAVETGINVSFLPITGLSSEFSAGDFTLVNTNCTGALSAGGSCTLDIKFTPTAAGLRTAALTATDSNGDTTTLILAGRTSVNLVFGQAFVNPPACLVEQQAGFCNEPSGGTTAANTYTLHNGSGAQITGLAITPAIPANPPTAPPGDFTVQSTTCTTTLAANQDCSVNVEFTPQGTGVRQGVLTATDAQGDSGSFNLQGVGSDYQLALQAGQATEVTVIPGGTAVFNAQVTADSIFGSRGEQVQFACPTNLPAFSTCAFSPCPMQITPGTTTKFTITIVTSSKAKIAPPVTSCPGPGAGFVAPQMRAPNGAIRFAPAAWSRFPALALLAVALALLALAARSRGARIALASAGFAAIIFAGCGGHNTTPTETTPTGSTTMTIIGNALDASGNPINASRPMQFTLDVVSK